MAENNKGLFLIHTTYLLQVSRGSLFTVIQESKLMMWLTSWRLTNPYREERGFTRAQNKESVCNRGDIGDESLIPGSRRSPERGNGNSLQYSCLENTMGREALWATFQRVARSWACLSDWTYTHRGKENTHPVEYTPRSHAHISLAK